MKKIILLSVLCLFGCNKVKQYAIISNDFHNKVDDACPRIIWMQCGSYDSSREITTCDSFGFLEPLSYAEYLSNDTFMIIPRPPFSPYKLAFFYYGGYDSLKILDVSAGVYFYYFRL